MTLDHAWHLFPCWWGAMWNISSVDPCLQLWELCWKVQLCHKSCLMIGFFFCEYPMEMWTSSPKIQVQAPFHTISHPCQYQNEELAHGCCHWYLLCLLWKCFTSQLKMKLSLCCAYVRSSSCSWTSANASLQPASAHEGLLEWAVWVVLLGEYCRAVPGNSGSCSEVASAEHCVDLRSQDLNTEQENILIILCSCQQIAAGLLPVGIDWG